MPILELPPRPSLEINAAALGGLYAVNLAWLKENSVPPLAALLGCKYRRERPDRWSAMPLFFKKRVGDCEEFLTSGGALLPRYFSDWDFEGWLAEGGGPNEQHCYLMAGRRGTEKQVLDLAVLIGGMRPPPPEYHNSTRRVRVF